MKLVTGKPEGSTGEVSNNRQLELKILRYTTLGTTRHLLLEKSSVFLKLSPPRPAKEAVLVNLMKIDRKVESMVVSGKRVCS